MQNQDTTQTPSNSAQPPYFEHDDIVWVEKQIDIELAELRRQVDEQSGR
jgi:hypothetical protein